jgi:hypothetical protein
MSKTIYTIERRTENGKWEPSGNGVMSTIKDAQASFRRKSDNEFVAKIIAKVYSETPSKRCGRTKKETYNEAYANHKYVAYRIVKHVLFLQQVVEEATV